jgi:hypothetical protein
MDFNGFITALHHNKSSQVDIQFFRTQTMAIILRKSDLMLVSCSIGFERLADPNPKLDRTLCYGLGRLLTWNWMCWPFFLCPTLSSLVARRQHPLLFSDHGHFET